MLLCSAWTWPVLVLLLTSMYSYTIGSGCSMQRLPWSFLEEWSQDDILGLEQPVVFHSPAVQLSSELSSMTSLNRLRADHGDSIVILSSSNAFSHGKVHVPLREYLATIEESSAPSSLESDKVYYLFGDNFDGVWNTISEEYSVRGCGELCTVAGVEAIGVGGAQSGVAFHVHGPGFAEVVHGAKEWFFYPPEMRPVVERVFNHDNMTTSIFKSCLLPLVLSDTMRAQDISGLCDDVLVPLQSSDDIYQLRQNLKQCTIYPDELIYFPSNWMHATLNVGVYNVFVSTFLDPQLLT